MASQETLVATAVCRMARVKAARIFGVCVLICGGAAIVFGKKLLDFPVALLSTNTEFEILFGD